MLDFLQTTGFYRIFENPLQLVDDRHRVRVAVSCDCKEVRAVAAHPDRIRYAADESARREHVP